MLNLKRFGRNVICRCLQPTRRITTEPVKDVPVAPKLLGIAGLIPFVGTSALAVYMPEAVVLVSELQATYGASILSFMGAVHFGLAMADYGSTRYRMLRYSLSTVPCLIGFFTLVCVPHIPMRLIIEALAFNGLLYGDYKCLGLGLVPKWYLKLRIGLTSIVTLCLGTNLYISYQKK